MVAGDVVVELRKGDSVFEFQELVLLHRLHDSSTRLAVLTHIALHVAQMCQLVISCVIRIVLLRHILKLRQRSRRIVGILVGNQLDV